MPQTTTTRYITVANEKGGAGKSSTALNLGAAFVQHQPAIRVLLIDTDPSGNLSLWLRTPSDGESLKAAFLNKATLPSLVRTTHIDRLELIPSGRAMTAIETMIDYAIPARFRTAVRAFDGRYAFVIIDTPPGIKNCTWSGLAAASEIIVPVDLGNQFSEEGLGTIDETLSFMEESWNVPKRPRHILALRLDRRERLGKDFLLQLEDEYGDRVLNTVIRKSVSMGEAISAAQPVCIHDPASRASKDFRRLAEELLVRGEHL